MKCSRALRGPAMVGIVGMAIVAGGAGPPAGTEAATRPATLPTVGASAAEVELLISDLDQPDWRVRQRAQAKLIEIGPSIEPRLKKLLAGKIDAQARLAAITILARIESIIRMGPTRVSLHVRGVQPKEAFAQLSRQAGIAVTPFLGEKAWERRSWEPVTLDLTDCAFWDAMRRTCVKAGLRPLFAGGEQEVGRILLTGDAAGEMNQPVAFGGPFMILASSATRRRALAGARESDVELQFTFFGDPKWRILQHPVQAPIDQVDDGAGHPLPRPRPMRMLVYKPESPIWIMRTMAPKVPLGVMTLGRIAGNFKVTLLEMTPPVEFTDVMSARNVMKRVGRQSLELKSVESTGDGYKVGIMVGRNGLSQQEWRESREIDEILLEDEDGHKFTRRSVESTIQNGDQMIYSMTFVSGNDFDAPGKPAKLVCRVPLEPREMVVPFELKDVSIQK